MALAQRPRPGREARELLAEELSPRSSAVAKCVMAPTSCTPARRGGRLRDPRRLLGVARAQAPHPVSSLTCTRPPPRAATAVDERLAPRHDVGAGRQRGVELLGLSAPSTSSGPSTPAARSAVASLAVATASHVAPPASAARAAAIAPWP